MQKGCRVSPWKQRWGEMVSRRRRYGGTVSLQHCRLQASDGTWSHGAAVIASDGSCYVGFAHQRPDDAYDRHIGYLASSGRALKAAAVGSDPAFHVEGSQKERAVAVDAWLRTKVQEAQYAVLQRRLEARARKTAAVQMIAPELSKLVRMLQEVLGGKS